MYFYRKEVIQLDKKTRERLQSELSDKEAQLAEQELECKNYDQLEEECKEEKKALEAEIRKLKNRTDADIKRFTKDLKQRYQEYMKAICHDKAKAPAAFSRIVIKTTDDDEVYYSSPLNVVSRWDGFRNVNGGSGSCDSKVFIEKDNPMLDFFEKACKGSSVIILEADENSSMPVQDRFMYAFLFFSNEVGLSEDDATNKAVALVRELSKSDGLFRPLYDMKRKMDKLTQEGQSCGENNDALIAEKKAQSSQLTNKLIGIKSCRTKCRNQMSRLRDEIYDIQSELKEDKRLFDREMKRRLEQFLNDIKSGKNTIPECLAKVVIKRKIDSFWYYSPLINLYGETKKAMNSLGVEGKTDCLICARDGSIIKEKIDEGFAAIGSIVFEEKEGEGLDYGPNFLPTLQNRYLYPFLYFWELMADHKVNDYQVLSRAIDFISETPPSKGILLALYEYEQDRIEKAGD